MPLHVMQPFPLASFNILPFSLYVLCFDYYIAGEFSFLFQDTFCSVSFLYLCFRFAKSSSITLLEIFSWPLSQETFPSYIPTIHRLVFSKCPISCMFCLMNILDLMYFDHCINFFYLPSLFFIFFSISYTVLVMPVSVVPVCLLDFFISRISLVCDFLNHFYLHFQIFNNFYSFPSLVQIFSDFLKGFIYFLHKDL